MSVNPIPENYPRLSPYINCKGAKDAIVFYNEVFGFEQRGPAMETPDGMIGHAELELGDSLMMISDVFPGMPNSYGVSPTLSLYVENVDATYALAIEKGASGEGEPQTQFYGDRSAALTDPWGNRWHIASHVEDVTPEEMGRRMAEMGDPGEG